MKLCKIIIIVGLLGLISCEKGPNFSLSHEQIEFNSNHYSKTIIIKNESRKEITWTLSEVPDWLFPLKTAGTIEGASEGSITLSTDVHCGKGSYSTSIFVNTDAGTKAIAIDYILDYETTIFPGLGIKNFLLFEHYSHVFFDLGGPDLHAKYFDSNAGLYLHIIKYVDLGYLFFFVNDIIEIRTNDPILQIEVQSPYEGVTEENVGISTSLSSVLRLYGEDYKSRISNDYTLYSYENKGILFVVDAQNNVRAVDLYPPYSNSKSIFYPYFKEIFDSNNK